MTVLFFPDFSGANPYQSNLADGLGAAGETVVMGARTGLFPLLRTFRANDGVGVAHIHWLDPYLFGRSRPETVVRTLSTLFQLLVLRALGVRVVWTVHNVRSHESPSPRLEHGFKHLFCRYLCDRLFVHCEAVKGDIVEAYRLPERTREKMVAIHHGHYIDDYQNGVSREAARAELDIGPDERVFLFFGQIRPYKGVFELVEAFQSAAGEGARLVVAGNPHTEAIEARLRAATAGDDRIDTHLEFIPDDRIAVYMNAADAVVLPFQSISTSGSAVLAMSFGKALVLPRLGCVPELLDDGGAIMYDPTEPDALTEALRAAQTRDLPAMGAHNYELAKANDWEAVARRTATVYRDVRSTKA